jgi:hypothetical protein
MTYRLTTHCRRYDHCLRLRLAISPVRNANFLSIEHQFSHTPLEVFFQILDYRPHEHSGYLQTLLFSRDTYPVEDLVRMATNERIHPSASDWNFQFSSAIIIYFCFPDWCALFGFSLNPVENLLLTIGVKTGMLPSLYCRLQSLCEFRLHIILRGVELPHQIIDRNRNRVLHFCDITSIKICWHPN